MTVYAVVVESWNGEYGYSEYSLPLRLRPTEELADEYAESIRGDYPYLSDQVIVVPYEVN